MLNISSKRKIFISKKVLIKSITFLLFAILISIPLFCNLGKDPISLWDESRVASNAYEMYKNGNYLIPHYKGNPDMWSTKPPLMIWLQTITLKVFGVNPFSIRLPSAIAAFCTALLLLLFVYHFYKNYFLAVTATIILISSTGYVGYHAARTGDYDALLAFFTTFSAFSFFLFCEYENKKWLYLFFISITLGVLTKSVNALLFLPAIFIYALIQKKVLKLLKDKDFYIGLSIFIVVVAGYYFGRELLNPGYLKAVSLNELGGRYLSTIEGHKHAFNYYHQNFIFYRFSPWYFFIPAGIIATFFIKNPVIKRVTLYATLLCVTFFLIISLAQTKLLWYDVPLYPLMTLMILPLFQLIIQLFNLIKNQKINLFTRFIPYILFIALLIVPYSQIITKTFKSNRTYLINRGYEVDYFLQEAYDGNYNLTDHHLVFDGYGPQHIFHLHMLQEKGVSIHFQPKADIAKNQHIILFQDEVKTFVAEHFNYDEIYQYGKVFIYFIKEKKE